MWVYSLNIIFQSFLDMAAKIEWIGHMAGLWFYQDIEIWIQLVISRMIVVLIYIDKSGYYEVLSAAFKLVIYSAQQTTKLEFLSAQVCLDNQFLALPGFKNMVWQKCEK